jgi:hypothetical protein
MRRAWLAGVLLAMAMLAEVGAQTKTPVTRKDPDAAVDALHQLFPQTNKGAKDLTKQQWLDSYELLFTRATKGKTAGFMAAEDWDALLKLLSEYGGMDRPLAAAEYYTNDFVDWR